MKRIVLILFAVVGTFVLTNAGTHSFADKSVLSGG